MRVLIDTDVLLDVALNREPFVRDSRQVLRWAQDEPRQAAVGWHSLSNLAYLTGPTARDFIRDLTEFVEIAPVSTREARQALGFPMTDFEDALQAAAALAFDALFVVTRNIRDYKGSPVPPISPSNFLKELGKLSLA
jgi:predicted nucleic acid-binding protein